MDSFLEYSDTGVESVITTFSNNGNSVKLYPMIHFGTLPFYERVTNDAKKLDAVLYENFDSNNNDENLFISLFTKDYLGNHDYPLSEILVLADDMFYSHFARIFGLTEQSLEQINYSDIDTFHVADLSNSEQTIEENYFIEGKNHDGLKLFYNYIGQLLIRMDLMNFVDMLSKGEYSDSLKNIYDATINSIREKSEFSNVVSFAKPRENHVINSLESLIDNHKNVGIIYGRDHMDSFSNYLKNRDYKITSCEKILVLPKIPPRFQD